ncbi:MULTISPECIES: transcriptional initiation protein Tat [Asaia]|uniref:transcriptional initiation protein Tat n=1 Tax=Asaia TaxID=91914 RepID=UPI002FC2F91D
MALDRRKLILAAASLGMAAPVSGLAATVLPPTPAPQNGLSDLSRLLASLPRRRQFTTVPRLLDHPDLWDDVAFDALLAYRGQQKMIGTGTSLAGNWPSEAQNLLNSEIFSFVHPDALLVMALWGEAQLALYNEAAWSHFDLARLVAPGQTASPLHQTPAGTSRHHQDEQGAYGAAGRSIPALQARGVVFLACHNAIWAHAGRLIALGAGPAGLSQEQLAAELTNALDPRAIVTPSALGALAELQRAGFSRIF